MNDLLLHGGSMERNSSSDKKAAGRLDARQGGAQALRANSPNQMGQSGEAEKVNREAREAPLGDRRS